jgi:hypothetical protein
MLLSGQIPRGGAGMNHLMSRFFGPAYGLLIVFLYAALVLGVLL